MSAMIKKIGLIGVLVFTLAACAATHPEPRPHPEPPARANRGKELGKQFLVEARKQYQFVKDQEVTDVVNAMGRRLATAAGRDPDAFHFFIVKEVQPNAFAIPGGYIFIFEGLLTKLTTEDELAGVLAHEIAHVTRDHFFKDDPKVTALDLATIAAILLSRGNQAATSIALATDISVQLQFSRENEEEADAAAIQYIKNAGYDPMGLLRFFRRLIGHGNIHGVDMPAYLSTHPALGERIQMVELRMSRPADRPLREPRKAVDWDRVQVRARAKSQTWQDVKTLLPDLPPGEASEARSRYLSGLAYLVTDRTAEAIAEFGAALALSPSNPIYHADLAMAYLKTQDVEKARAEAMKSLDLSEGGEPPLTAYLVLGMLEEHAGQLDKALQYYQDVIRQNPDHVFANYHAGQIYFQTGRSAEGAYHTGRYLRLGLNPEAALKEFKRAKGLAEAESELRRMIQKQIDQIREHGI